MPRQARIFLESEGNAWYERNAAKLPPQSDPIIDVLDQYKIKPRSVYEVGCADGWRLRAMQEKYRCSIGGIDPSSYAVAKTGLYANCTKGDATRLENAKDGQFHVVVYGWCLYLADIADYLLIAAEGSRILKDNGYIVIHDFYSDQPHSRPYSHKPGIMSHKMDFARLWLGHPGFSLFARQIYGDGDNTTTVTVLHKHFNDAFPVRT